MNKIKLFSLSLVALFMACFTACESKYDVDHTAHIVGTWTYIGPNYAEALVIKEDGSVLSTGVEDGEYWENVAGTIKIKGNVATMTFEDGDNAIGHIDVVPGIAFSIYEEDGEEWTFNYCANDLSDEIVGMWVCNDGPAEEENDMAIMSYSTEGKVTMTTPASTFVPTDFVNLVFDYKVVGDLLFKMFPKENLSEGANPYLVSRLTYSPNGTSLGDVLIENQHTPTENGVMELTFSFLRVKESLNFTGQTYDYVSAYVTNAKGKDEDFTIAGETFNIANITGYDFNELFGSDLFSVEFPNANTIKHKFRPNGQNVEDSTPITVDGNKVTLDMGASNPAWRTVEMYMFQDKDDTQLHMFMSTQSCINYLANFAIPALIEEGKLDPADPAAVDAVFTAMAARIESINVSMVFKARK